MRAEQILPAVSAALSTKLDAWAPVRGGDICDAGMVTSSDGTKFFVKTHRDVHVGFDMFAAEAEGLAWLGEPGVLRVPKVLAVSDRERSTVPFLVLEWIAPGSPARDYDEALGRGLARLHQSGPVRFGWPRTNFIGPLPQRNELADDWATFFRTCRLEPQVRCAVDSGALSSSVVCRFEQLYACLPELLGPSEVPARLHGDLWSGNAHVDGCGAPCLIDPAVYGGHREVDLAMMRLFGGFSERVFDAYQDFAALSPGHAERVPLYQLYPLLVHVNLFGGSYVSSVNRVLTRYGC